MTDNIVKKVCKEIEIPIITLKSSIDDISTKDIDKLDILIKELVNVRAVFDFIHNKQLTKNNWIEIQKALK